MYTKVNHINSAKVWFFLGTITLPLALVILFEVLKGRQVVIGAWVWSVMAPLEQVLGRLWSLFPVSVAEVFAVLFLSGCTVWLGRAIVLVVHQKKPILFLRRLLGLGIVWLWLWAGLCWFWNAAYYVPS